MASSHSYSHPDLSLLSLDQVRAEIMAADAAITGTICARPRVFRAPYGSLTAEAQQLLYTMGYQVLS